MPDELRRHYHRRLDDVEDVLLDAAYRVAEMMPRVSHALASGDTGIGPVAEALRDDVSRSCQEVEDRCFRLMALQTPVAGDLRMLVAMLRLVTHVDRACVLLSHAAFSTRRLVAGDLPQPLGALLSDLAVRSAEVFRAGIDAWRTRDAGVLGHVVRSDEGVDALQVELLERARALALSNDELVELGLLARYYERIADHGVAFARDVTFVMTGERPVTRV